MAETQTQTPVPVQLVPAPDPEAAAEARFAEKLGRMGGAPTMQPGDRERRPLPDQPAPAEQTREAPAEGAAPAETAEDNYEFDYDGDRYQVPAKLKALHETWEKRENMDRDYTQKMQELAEVRRSAEAALQQSKHQQELQQALAPQVQRLNAAMEQRAAYMKVDWNSLFQSDPNAAQQHSVQFSVLNTTIQTLEREIQQTAHGHMTKISDAQKQMLEAADKAMATKVKGWSRDTGKALNEFARKTYGFTENEVNSTLDPRALEMMHDARQWRDLQSTKSSKVVIPEKTLKPAGSTPASTAQSKVSELRKGFRTAKTEGQRDAIAQAILMQKIR